MSSSGPRKSKKWTQAEEIALAKAFMAISQDNVVGSAQKRQSFYHRVLDHFHALMGEGEYRTFDQINAKWKDLSRKVTAWAGVYNNFATNRRSGQSDDDVYNAALQQFRLQHDTAFTLRHVWDVLKEFPKWRGIPPMQISNTSGGSSKRTKNSESNTFTTNSIPEEMGQNDTPEFTPEADPQFTEPRRPPGRNTGKRSSSSLSGSMSLNSVNDQISDLNSSFKTFLTNQEKLIKIKEEQKAELIKLREDQKEEKAMAFFFQPHDHLQGVQRRNILKVKRKIAEKYGLEMEDEDQA